MDLPPEQALRDYQADRQTREVYRYFQPKNPAALNATLLELDEHVASLSDFSAVTTPVVHDDLTSETSATEVAPSSPNTTLTAFAQLAALRLNAQRAFITVLNTDLQYVLAEATRSTNIRSSKSSVGEGDELLVGTSTLSTPWNICQETVAIDKNTQDELYPFLVINDLEQEERFKDLPFVKEKPHSRFYAGTPLTSDRGINLGCLFVLDPEPREGLCNIEKDTLGKVAELVMDYLLVSRQAAEGRHASRLSRGLHLFVDGNSSFASNSRMSSCSNSPANSISTIASPHPKATRSTNFHGSEPKSLPAGSEPGDGYSQHGTQYIRSDVDQNDMSAPASSTGSFQSSGQASSSSRDSSNSNNWLFQRAANLLRQSLDLDGTGGVMFMEARDKSSEYIAHDHCDSAESKTPAPILALSTENDPFSYQTNFPLSDPSANLDNDFLKQLTHRYPKGRLWSFHRDGTFSTTEDRFADETRKQRKKSRLSETRKLNEYFPDACQVMFVPLWNATDSQWFAGCFCWTHQPSRVFSRAIDLTSVFAFGSSIMTEYSRVESVIADRQKGDFISSISHELRSPLHGVMAAAEFLGSTSLDQFQDTLLDTINACGRTLLDVMNQVLDFSKIMTLERHKRSFKRGKDPWKPRPTEEIPRRLDELVTTDVALLTEDVVNSVCLGHSHAQRSAMSISHPATVPLTSFSNPTKTDGQVETASEVEVVVDISDNNWKYKVQPGSLRRLIMNILGNSLKHTKQGRVLVSIEVTENFKSRSRRQGLEDSMTLTISDTGKGISKEYLRKHLFTPFSQEDPLSVGTGLGLSIVRGIVKSLSGKISIRSRQGEGTIVKVSFPLERVAGEETPDPIFHEEPPDRKKCVMPSQLCRRDFAGKRVAIWGLDSAQIENHQFWSPIARYITKWYGLQLVSLANNESVDVLLADEKDLSGNEMQHFPGALPSLLIFASGPSTHGDCKAKWTHLAESIAILHPPCGPQKLAKSILTCLDTAWRPPTPQLQTTEHKTLTPGHPALVPSGQSLEDSRTSCEKESPEACPSHSMQGPGNCAMNLAELDTANRHRESSGSNRSIISSASPASTVSSASPASSASAASIRSSSGSPYPVQTSADSQPQPRVLVVDDNNINLQLMVTFLNKRNLVVLDKADDGRAAVDTFEHKSQGYDLIFMDLSMPVMDGFEATRVIRAIEKERDGCPPATIIALTGLSSSRDESKAMESGMNSFITKPVSFKKISRILEEWKATQTRTTSGGS